MGEIIDTAVGINIHFLPDGAKDISFCVLTKKKGVLAVVKIQSGFNQLSDINVSIKNFLERGVRVHINMSGLPVLLRMGDNELKANGDSDFAKSFPGIKKDEFIAQRYNNKAASFYSLLRKEDGVREVNLLNAQAHSMTLGFNILEAISSFIGEEKVHIHDYVLNIRSAAIVEINKSENHNSQEFEISGERVNADCILAYASAVHLFLPLEKIEVSGLPIALSQEPQKYNTRKRLFIAGRQVLLGLLAVLLVKTIVFFWFGQEINEAESRLSYFNGRSQDDNRSRRISTKMLSAYDGIGWSMNRIPLFYADQLASTVPSEIRLDVLEIGVLDESILRKDKRHAFDRKQIKVFGASDAPSVLNRWISSLQKVKWIKEITDQKYQHDNKQRKGMFEFTIWIDGE